MDKNIKAGRLFFSTNINTTVDDADAVFIAVGTPTRRGDGHADLSFIYKACEEVALASTGDYKVIIIKSTVPVGTNAKVRTLMNNTNPNIVFDVVSNPEFLREGSAVEDFMKPDRVIVGLDSDRAKNIMDKIYKSLVQRDFPIMYTGRESAEMIKYASNAFLALKISFINEIASICEGSGADVESVSKGMGLDSRIGNKFLNAGPGYGGSCFPKDTSALCHIGREFDAPQLITEAAILANENVKMRMVQKVVALCGGDVNGKSLSVFGVTFKPNTDDMRDAPSIKIITELQSQGAHITVVDPKGEKEGRHLLNNVNWLLDPYLAADQSECIIILTEWNEFRALNLSKLSNKMKDAKMADLRNIYTENEVLGSGFIGYDSVGR